MINKHKHSQTKDKERREYNKQYADRTRHTEPSNINVGDTVLVRQEKHKKLTTKFNQTPYTVNKQEMIRSNRKEQKKPRVDRLRGNTCPYVFPQTGLN